MAESDRLSRRREGILAAAERVFDARGYAATTIEAVAEEAGVAKGSVYNYFSSKRELFSQVFAHMLAGAEADTGRLLSGKLTASEKLEKLLDYWAERLGYYKRFGRLVLESWATAAREEQEGGLATTFREMYGRWREQIGAVLAEGVESGEFSPELDTSAAAALILATLDGIMIQSILGMGIVMDEGFLAALKRSIMLALKRERGPAQARSSEVQE